MIVCNCNRITERQVKAAIEAGAEKWTDVHAHYECAPQCGCCGVEIAEYINPPEQDDLLPLGAPVFSEA